MLCLEPRAEFDKCIIGKCSEEERLVYSIEKILETLMSSNTWDMEDALEWFHYNILRTFEYSSEGSPIFIYTDFELDLD
jgi:hypothetical protein